MQSTLAAKLKHLPDRPGAYMMKDERGEIIYVGKAASLRNRVRSYFQSGQSAKVLVMVGKVADVDWLVTDSEVEALMLECNLIKKYHPRYNVRLRDDKHYPYVCVTTSETFPRVIVVRRVRRDGNRYFGPYADSSALRESLRLVRKVFRIRSCGKKFEEGGSDRPCLNLHLGQCDSPCSGAVGPAEYEALVRDALLFLEGKQEPVVARLTAEMEAAAESLEFERAARARDGLASIRKLTERQKVISTDQIDYDVIAASGDGVQVFTVRAGRLTGEDHFFLEGATGEEPETSLGGFIKQFYRDAAFLPKEIFVSHEPDDKEVIEEWLSATRGSRVRITRPQRGEKAKLVALALENAAMAVSREGEDLQALAEALGLDAAPARIEAFDISNIQGTETVASMVVFEGGAPAKSQYRRFKIKSVTGPDDYASMREVIRRRLEDPRQPDLMLIDGGRGQLNSALDAMREAGREVPVVSLAKRMEEIYTPERSQPILLPRDSGALRLLQRIRDEAHRFALAYHHKLREKGMKRSLLDSVPGVGETRRKALIRRFGSVVGVREASVEEIAAVPGVPQNVAEAVYDALHRD
ncbi:MAG: excinuclease ABC subunit UvrC [Armatimonadota bacterium]